MCPVAAVRGGGDDADCIVHISAELDSDRVSTRLQRIWQRLQQHCSLSIQQPVREGQQQRHLAMLRSALLHLLPAQDVNWLVRSIAAYSLPVYNLCALPILQPSEEAGVSGAAVGVIPSSVAAAGGRRSVSAAQRPLTHAVSLRARGAYSRAALHQSVAGVSAGSVSWYSSLGCSLSHFGGLPFLVPGEAFPVCLTCGQRLRLLFQILLCDLPAAVRDCYVPEAVLNSHRDDSGEAGGGATTPVSDSLLQAFYCPSQQRCCEDADSLLSYSSASGCVSDRPAPSLGQPSSTAATNAIPVLRWVRSPQSAAVPRSDYSTDEHLADRGDQCQLLLGWQLRNDVVGVDEAVEEYKFDIWDWQEQERIAELQTEDSSGILRNTDKFGGFPPGLNRLPRCPLAGCGQPMQLLFCLTHLCSNVEKKGDSYHVSICPVHKHLFAATFW